MTKEELEKEIQNEGLLVLQEGRISPLEWMMMENKSIPDFEEKFKLFVSHQMKIEPLAADNLLVSACSYCEEDVVKALLELGFDPNNYSNFNVNSCLMYTLILPSGKMRYDAKTVIKKQKQILQLLVKHGVSLDFLRSEGNYLPFFQTICNAKQQHCFKWINAVSHTFNEQQKQDWKKIRLFGLVS